MDKLWATLAFLILAGCSVTLRPDPSAPAADVGYPTAEFRAQGRTFNGLGEVAIDRGTPLDAVAFEVQGYHEGTIHVDSGDCGISQSWSYKESAAKAVKLQGLAEVSCLIDIVVVPAFGLDAQGQRVYEMKGQLLIKVLDAGHAWEGFASKVRAGGDQEVSVLAAPPDPASPVRVFFRGCDSSYDQTGQLVNGAAAVKATALAGPIQERRCLFEGAVQQGTYVKRISWHVWGYREDFTPLPLPSIDDCGSRLCVTADESVSLLALDDDSVFDTEAKFRFDPAKPHTLRAMTVKGRSFVCSYNPTSRGWECQN